MYQHYQQILNNKIRATSNMVLTFIKAKYYNPFLGCPPGYRKQTGYTRKNGKRIPTRCVHDPSANADKKEKGRGWFTRSSGGGLLNAFLTPSTRRCPKGYVYRKGYTRKFHKRTRRAGYYVRRKDGTRYKIFPKTKTATVKASCIKPQVPGSRKKRVIASSATNVELAAKCKQLKLGEMSRYNYQYRQPATTRRIAIKKAIQTSSPVSVQKRLALAAKCSAAVKPAASKVFKEDADYIEDTYAIESLLKR